MRAADADRQFVAGRLRDALNEGRLNLSEYDERLQDAYAAKTYGDLDKILDDLPVASAAHSQVAPVTPPVQPAAQATEEAAPAADRLQPRRMAPWLLGVWSAWLIAVSVNVVIWLLVSISAGQLIYFWPMWVAGPWGAVLLATTLTGIASGEGYQQRYKEKWERKQARRRERFERRRERWG
ncbi:MAG: DUF1707 domain-containing protein [Micromonosporaceae bacterium]|nr:DUF1707 domain-containing protein [Micromonosporaceae bacterium]